LPAKTANEDNNKSFQQISFSDSSVNPTNIKKYIHIPLQYDSSDIVMRSVDSAKILIHLKDKDFKYFKDPDYSKTLWERLMDWIERQLAKLTEYDSYYTMWDIIMYVLIAIAVAAIIFGFYKSEFKGLFISNKNNVLHNVSESFEDIHSLDYAKMIEEAIANKNFRYAIRLNYLRSLKILSDKKIINWKVDKTNSEFASEIKHSTLKEKFKSITINFEYIWYGELEIDGEMYNQLQSSFLDFNSTLETV
jgi:hypothetical protein